MSQPGGRLGTVPLWQQAIDNGRLAHRNGEPRDPAPYLPRYQGPSGAKTPADWWLSGYDAQDERLAVELSRPRHGETEWSPVHRTRPPQP